MAMIDEAAIAAIGPDSRLPEALSFAASQWAIALLVFLEADSETDE